MSTSDATTPATPIHASSAPRAAGSHRSSGTAAATRAPSANSHARVAVEKYAAVGADALCSSAHPKDAAITTTAHPAATAAAARPRRATAGTNSSDTINNPGQTR